MKIGILFGGNSLEHEISIVSAYSLKKKLEDTYDIDMLYIDFNNDLFNANKLILKDFKNNNLKGLKRVSFSSGGVNKKKIDCMILALHGENGEDGIAAALCRFYNIPFVGSDIMASSIAIDKYSCYKYLSSNNIPMIDTRVYTYEDYINGNDIDKYPVIVKPIYGGSSIGIYVCRNKDEFDNKIIEALRVSKEVIIQPYYDNILEYNLAIYNSGYSKLERIDKKDEIFSFDNKYNESFKLMHQAIDDDYLIDDFKKLGRSVYDLLKCSGIIRIDFFLIDNKIYVNEVNILPGGLAMYLIDDFKAVIHECIVDAMKNKKVVYQRGNFLADCRINK